MFSLIRERIEKWKVGVISCMLGIFLFSACSPSKDKLQGDSNPKKVYQDQAFTQEYSVKYDWDGEAALIKAFSDRNRAIKILSSDGLLLPVNGAFLSPGYLIQDQSYLSFQDDAISDLTISQGQFSIWGN